MVRWVRSGTVPRYLALDHKPVVPQMQGYELGLSWHAWLSKVPDVSIIRTHCKDSDDIEGGSVYGPSPTSMI